MSGVFSDSFSDESNDEYSYAGLSSDEGDNGKDAAASAAQQQLIRMDSSDVEQESSDEGGDKSRARPAPKDSDEEEEEEDKLPDSRPIPGPKLVLEHKPKASLDSVISRKHGKPLVISNRRPYNARPTKVEGASKLRSRDPRFSARASEWKEERWASQYKFLEGMMNDEIKELETDIGRGKKKMNPYLLEKKKRELASLQGVKKSRMKRSIELAVTRDHLKKEVEMLKSGAARELRHLAPNKKEREVRERLNQAWKNETVHRHKKKPQRNRDRE